MRRLRDLAVADHHIHSSAHDRSYKFRDVGAGVLIVGVGIDDDVGGDAERAIESVLRQEAPFPFELILVSAAPLTNELGTGVRNVIEPNRNPATRRNRAVSEARGEILAFIDDDAIADAGWLSTAVS